MARDRKRAKQRRDRARRAPGATPQRTTRRRDDEGQGTVPPASPEGISRAEQESTLEPPEALDNASAEVDLAHAQIARGRPDEPIEEDADAEELENEVEASEDELQDAPAARNRARTGAPAERDVSGAPTSGGNRVVAFLQASSRELQRVQWPDRRQVTQATGVVLAFVVIAGLFLGLCDVLFNHVVDAIL